MPIGAANRGRRPPIRGPSADRRAYYTTTGHIVAGAQRLAGRWADRGAHLSLGESSPGPAPKLPAVVIVRPSTAFSQDRFDLLANVEPASADLDARQDAAACPAFDGRDWRVQQTGDFARQHHVVGRQPSGLCLSVQPGALAAVR
jgi:hypothetical protein